MSQRLSSVRQKASGAKLASCPMTSGVCVEGSKLTRPVMRQAARPTVKWYRSVQTFSTWRPEGRLRARRWASDKKRWAVTGTPPR